MIFWDLIFVTVLYFGVDYLDVFRSAVMMIIYFGGSMTFLAVLPLAE